MFPYTQLADADGNPLAVSEVYRLSYAETAGNGELLDWLYRPLEEVKLADNYTNQKSSSVEFWSFL